MAKIKVWRIITPIANSVGVQPTSGLMGRGDAFLPRATLRLHGVINVSPLRGRERELKRGAKH